MDEKNTVALELSGDEALILFEFLSRLNERARPELFEDQAEERALWTLEALLQRVLVEPFRSDYAELVQQARSRLRDRP